MTKFQKKLGLKPHPARLFTRLANGNVQCHLSPRECIIKPDQAGFCQVRKNEGGELVTLNYGVSVQLTQEFIETEACNHFAPGAEILSLGNIGCMMVCDFCHNWKTSQVKHVEKSDLHFYTPEQVVQTALDKGIGILSWTYNDPVVWHEFVIDTAKLAREAGLINLYKSAFSINPRAIDELCEVIDIFSLSLKSMDPDFYRKITKGELQPVLDGIKQVHAYGGKHLELSNLCVTGRNDTIGEVEKVVHWMLDNIGDEVPLHIVRFHPDFRYTHVERTSIPFLIAAREHALKMGLKYVYLGNVYEQTEGLHTRCRGCNEYLVTRFGLDVKKVHLSDDGSCLKCGTVSQIIVPKLRQGTHHHLPENASTQLAEFRWYGDINACHLQFYNSSNEAASVFVTRIGELAPQKKILMQPKEKWRIIHSKSGDVDHGVCITGSAEIKVNVLEVKDRAHFPVEEGKTQPKNSNIFKGNEFARQSEL